MIRVIFRCPACLLIALSIWPVGYGWAQKPSPRAPVPAEADRAKSIVLVREIFAKDVAAAKTSKQKTELAGKLLRHALESRKRSADHYVLLRVARDLAISAGDPATTSSAIEKMAAVFEVDPASLHVTASRKLQKKANSTDQRKTLAKVAAQWADEALTDDDYRAARALLDTALEMARKGRDAALAHKLAARRKEITSNAKTFTASKAALEKLRDDPSDPTASLVVGRYYCFVKNDWRTGIAFLAAGGDSELGRLARSELKAKKGDQDVLSLADAWWAMSQQEQADAKTALMSRAGLWYKKLPQQKGLARVRIEKRLAEIAKIEKEVTTLSYELQLSGDNQYLRTNLVWNGSPITVEVIATPATIPVGRNPRIVADTEGSGFAILLNRAGYYEFKVFQNGQSDYVKVRSKAKAVVGKEVHIAGLFDGRRLGLFLDGVLQSTKGFSAKRGPRLSKREVLIGADPGKAANSAHNFFHGSIESVMISSGARYRRNFTPNHDLSQGIKKSSVVLHLDFRAGQENGLLDRAQRPNTITAIGKPTFVDTD